MADSVGNNAKISKLPVKEEPRPPLKEINHFLTCILCNGYFVDATTIVECLHTYCRSCIVKFLETTKFCPICDVQVHRTKPHLSLRHDAIMQRLVYKIVPGLYTKELQRKKNFLAESDPTTECGPILNGEQETECYIAPDELIPLSLEYVENKADIHNSNVTKFTDSNESADKESIVHRRYLACPAKLKIKHLYKFIKEKYELRQNQKVEIFYDNIKLPSSFSFMDIAYTFSWKGDTTMRLCYQILESTVIKVPAPVRDEIADDSALPNTNVTKSISRGTLNNGAQKPADSRSKTTRNENSSTKVNLKRKPECVAEIAPDTTETTPLKPKATSKEEKIDDFELLEPSIKIPRISKSTLKDIMDAKKDGHEDKPKPTATVSPCTAENTLKPSCKPVVEEVADDFIKYEQDIEEVDDEDDDDDDGRLRISQLSEEDTRDEKCEDQSDRRLVIDTSDVESTKDDRKENKPEGDGSKKSAKYKRKNKKSKHSHHHKHHRHHERKKQAAPQATILHSPDTDIMKLKLKLNNPIPEVKHHKQRRKRKKSSECYFSSSFSSSSSVSSASGMSPDAHGASRVDEDSSHSRISEFSTDLDTPTKEEPTPKMAKIEDTIEKYTPPANKEKLLQMRAFRPKSIAVVKPEENHKREKPAEKPKNDNNNNTNDTVVATDAKEKDKPKPVPTILRPPSSITVSKITAAEKHKMEQEKLHLMNGNNDDKPSLEIMLVNGPPSSTKSFASIAPPSADCSKPKTPPRQIRPPPAAIPLLQYHKMKSTEPTLPKSLTITPQIQRSKSVEAVKKVKDTLSIRDGAKRTVTVSLSGNPFENEYAGALDLSSGKSSPKYPDTINVPQTLLNKKLCINGGGVRPMPNGVSNYSPVKCMSSLAENVRQFHQIASPNRYSGSASPKHKISVASPQTSPKQVATRTLNPKISKSSVPNLNEIKIGPVSSTTETLHKPGPNQTVRHIPNPSIMLQRHQAINSIASANGVKEYLPIKLPNSTSIVQHRISPANASCSFSTLKKNDKCPPAIPLKGYLDVSSIMATK